MSVLATPPALGLALTPRQEGRINSLLTTLQNPNTRDPNVVLNILRQLKNLNVSSERIGDTLSRLLGTNDGRIRRAVMAFSPDI